MRHVYLPPPLFIFATMLRPRPYGQVLFANGVALIWNTYFSYLSHHAAPTDPPAATDQVQETGPGRTA